MSSETTGITETVGSDTYSARPNTSSHAPMVGNVVIALPDNGGTSGNSRAPSNYWKYQRTEYLITPTEMAASGLVSGSVINAIGFLNYVAGVGTISGTLNVYLKNTTDASYTLGSSWTTTGFTQVSTNSTFSAPIDGNYWVTNFTGGSTFTYNGGGIYVAWEFASPSGTIGTTAVTHSCNWISGSTLLYGYRGTTLGTALTASAWRPVTVFSVAAETDIVKIANIYTHGKTATPYSTPTPVAVRVANQSASSATYNLTLTVRDVATNTVRYTNTQSGITLGAGSYGTTTFSGWTPTITEDVVVTASASTATGETFDLNNSLSTSSNVNTSTMSYVYNTASPPSGYGFTYPGYAIFAVKYNMNGSGTVTGANLVIASSTTATGNTISAVLLNSSGTLVASSPTYVIQATDLGTTKAFTFSTPYTISNSAFYVGMQTTAGTAQHYPLGLFYDIPSRGGINYTAAAGGGTPTEAAVNYRFGIEAVVAPFTGVSNPTSFTATPVSTTQINLAWALNASSNNVLLAYSTDGVFGTPVDGTVYSAGNTITGGGTVLQYNNGTSFNHTGLTPGTTYYYKVWSYSGSVYSSGVSAYTSTICNPSVAPITETFEGTQFPPQCWALSTGSPAWLRSASASGYGIGSASAIAPFYSISATTPFDLISLQVNTSALTSPVLRFDYAYATYIDEVDEMDIYYSTNNGTSYTLLQAMPGGVSGLLTTAPATQDLFVPTSSQWATKTLSLPAGTNKVKFTGISSYGNNLYIDNVKIFDLLPHDVGVISIDENPIITLGTISPKATFKNFGGNTETFSVTLSTYGYTSTKTVSGLAPDATVQVTFDPWTNALGDYSFIASTSLGSDPNTANNSVSASIKVLDLNKQVYAYQNATVDGPVKFSLSDPGSLNLLVDQTTLNGVFGGTWANGLWYGTVYNTVAPYNLVTIDPLSGARTVIGDMGVNMTGLSYNPANSTMYGVAYNSTTNLSSLYTIDLTTGAATLVGNTASNVLLINLAIDNAGNAYAMDLVADVVGTVNLTTGVFTVLGSTGIAANYAQDMEFDRDNGELYMAAYTTVGELRWVNKTSGSTILVGQFQDGNEITGFAIPYTSNKTLALKVFIEGLCSNRAYTPPPAGTQYQAFNDLGAQYTYPVADKIKVELRSAVDGSLITTFNNVDVNVDGTASISVSASYNGSYYLYVYHRNSITISSAVPVSFAGSTISYDFSTGVAQAFGSNMASVNGLSAMFSGDCSGTFFPSDPPDSLIDGSDMSAIEVIGGLFTVGYVIWDVNGDGLVDLDDNIITESNNNNFVAPVLPF